MAKGVYTSMIWKGKKCSSKEQLQEVKNYIIDSLCSRYKPVDIVDDRKCMLLSSGEVLSITGIFCEECKALCTEYADNTESMKYYFTTDGDLYPVDDFASADEMLSSIINEIESQ